MRKLILFLLIGLMPQTFAAESPWWNCDLTAQLLGDGEFFLRYGRDSWSGKGFLTCRGNKVAEVFVRTVDVTFNGAETGNGVNQTSVIQIDSRMMTRQSPDIFQLYAYLFNRKELPDVSWRHEGNRTKVDVEVFSEGVQNSLQQGILFIR